MILGIGTDLVSAKRIERLLFQFEEKFVTRIFTTNEILKANQIEFASKKISSEKNSPLALPRALFYAKRFAAKEAFAKALGLGIGRGINFVDIEISNDELGKPKIKILNKKEIFIHQHFACKNFDIHLSLSDENPLASAFVIIESL